MRSLSSGALRRAFVLLGTSLALALPAVASPTVAVASGCTFSLVPHPEPSSFDHLVGVDALTAKDIWAVGSKDATSGTLVEHWNRTKWSVVPSPNKTGSIELEAVESIGAHNVWAVGYFTSNGKNRTLIEHYNGTKWSIVSSPNPLSGDDNILFGIDAVSSTDIWAVGGDNLTSGIGGKQIILHFTGTKWVAVHGAALGSPGGGLAGVSAISKSNVVAVGHFGSGVGQTQPLVERFNGTSWAAETTPSLGAGAALLGVSTPSATAQWAVGSQGGSSANQTLTMRNTGSGWHVVPSQNSSATKTNELLGVSALSAGSAWAVGDHDTSSSRRTLIERFANGSWTIVTSPNKSGSGNLGDNVLSSVTALSSSSLWAVGTGPNSVGSSGLIVHGC